MYQLFLRLPKGKSTHKKYQEVAKSIGSGNRADHVKKILDSYALYKIMEKEDFYGINDLQDGDINFSLIPTAIGQTKFKDFLSLKGEPIVNNSKINRKNLKDFTHWVFEKDEDGLKRVGESRELKKLAHVVGDAKALKEFRRGALLDDAFSLTKGIEEGFWEQLFKAENALKSAISSIANILEIKPYLNKIKSIAKQANLLKQVAESSEYKDD